MKLEVRRVIPAPPEAVFKAWTDAKSMARWMRPGPTERTNVTLDPRVGGTFTIDMMGDGKTYAHRGEFKEIDPPRRLVFTWLADRFPHGSLVTVTFAKKGNGTEVVLVHEGHPDQASVDNHGKGWGDILAKLETAIAA